MLKPIEEVNGSTNLDLMERRLWEAWTAGIIDGEGSISISQNTKNGNISFYTQICVRMCSEKPLIKLSELWGGKATKCGKTPCENTIYAWFLPRQNTIDFGNLIMPFLMVKQKQMKLAIKFQERSEKRIGIEMVYRNEKHGHCSPHLTDEERKTRLQLRNEMVSLNRRGRFPPKNIIL